jgi:hypothetical protein
MSIDIQSKSYEIQCDPHFFAMYSFLCVKPCLMNLIIPDLRFLQSRYSTEPVQAGIRVVYKI